MPRKRKRKLPKRLALHYALAVLFIVIVFVIPIPYYAAFPGRLIDMGFVVDTAETEHFYGVTSNIYRNPYSSRLGLTDNAFEVNLFAAALVALRPSGELYRITPEQRDITTDQVISYQHRLMGESATLAEKLALEYLGLNGTVRAYYGAYAGSSGSLMVALEIVQQLGEDDLIRGRKIAGSGELLEDGTVTKIGSLRQKLAVAERENVDIFIVPEENRGDLPETKVTILYVDSLADAVQKLSLL